MNNHQLVKYFGPELMPFGRNSKQPTFIDKKYLEWIRQQPCVVTGNPCNNDAHHVIFKSQAKNDYSAIPLRHDEHMKLHNHKEGVDGYAEDNDIDFSVIIAAKLMQYIKHLKD